MDLSQLEVLVAIAEERSFSRAAQRLHRTQPAVSQGLRRLEDELGVALVDRSSKDGTLTAAGALLRDHARQLLNLRAEARAALRELQDLRRGKVTIAANEYTVAHLLPALAAFHRAHPELQVEVRRSPASDIPRRLLARDVELGVLGYRPAATGLAVLPFSTDELVLLVPPRHPLAGRARVSVRQLGGESFFAHNVASPARDEVVRTFARLRTPLRIVLELPTLDAIKRLVAAGVGVALMPRRVAEAEVARGEVVALRVAELRVPRSIFLVHRGAGALSHAARAFLASARDPGQPPAG